MPLKSWPSGGFPPLTSSCIVVGGKPRFHVASGPTPPVLGIELINAGSALLANGCGRNTVAGIGIAQAQGVGGILNVPSLNGSASCSAKPNVPPVGMTVTEYRTPVG